MTISSNFLVRFATLASRRILSHWLGVVLVASGSAAGGEGSAGGGGATPEPVPAVSFESAQPGPFQQLSSKLGEWKSTDHRAVIHDGNARSGERSLRLTGGKQASVVLELADPPPPDSLLTFWAERWTARGPFEFRVEAHQGDQWNVIYQGDGDIRVGSSFPSHIRIPLPAHDPARLRFTVTSPPDSGVLMDDVRIGPPREQAIQGVAVMPLTLPALRGTEFNPLLKLRITTTGFLNPIGVSELQGRLTGTLATASVTSVTVRLADQRCDAKLAADGTFRCVVDGGLPALSEGENLLWIECGLHESAELDGRIGAVVPELGFSNGQRLLNEGTAATQRLGVALRNGGDDGVHTYRIPGLATSNLGTLIAVYDVRHRSDRDLPGDIDVGLSRSMDGGRTWSAMQIMLDMGADPQWQYDGVGDPAVLVDRQTGTIWVAATWSHGDRSWHGSGPGLTPEETGQLLLVRSDDDGLTWSTPINITAQVKRPEWSFVLQGPGTGITMSDGTLVFAAQYLDRPDRNRLPRSTVIYSRDHGQTWHVGNGAFDDTTEAQVVELEPGLLMLNCRYNRDASRVVMTSRDLGSSWQEHPSSRRLLMEPRACMASLLSTENHTGGTGKGLLLFSNPDHSDNRRRMMIKASPDYGNSWPAERRILLDEGDSAGYSCLTLIDEQTVGILYEGSRADLTFQRVALQDLVSGSAQD